MTDKIDDGGPAFPQSEHSACTFFDGGKTCDGMSLRAYAAIKLRVPESGVDWLDDMIRRAKRDEFAGQALIGICQSEMGETEFLVEPEVLARAAYKMADAMLAARKTT